MDITMLGMKYTSVSFRCLRTGMFLRLTFFRYFGSISHMLRCVISTMDEFKAQYIGVSPNGKKPDDATKAAAEMISLYKKVNAAAQQAQIQEITLAAW